MATYRSDLHKKGVRLRATTYGDVHMASATIRLPSGSTVTSGDIWKFAIAGSNFVPLSYRFLKSGTLGTSTGGTFGYLQRLQSDGATAENEGYSSSGAALNASPTSDADAYSDGTTASTIGGTGVDTFDEWASTAAADVHHLPSVDFRVAAAGSMSGLGGPVDIAVTVNNTAANPLGADTYVTLIVEYTGVKVNPPSQPDYIYADRYNSSGVSSV